MMSNMIRATLVSCILVSVPLLAKGGAFEVSTKNGTGGISGYIQNPTNISVFGSATFHVKNIGSNPVTRKGYLRFDTSGLGFVPDEGTLSLTVSTIDTTIADSDQTIYVYGITNQTLDLVALTNGLAWSNAPANNPTSWHAADLTKAELLGSFILDYNGNYASPVGTVVQFSSTALASFVAADTNGLVTFILGRQGPGGTDGGSASLNLIFASDTHTTYSPPTLTLTLNTLPPDRPFIWVTNSEKDEILGKIASNAWAGTVYSGMVARVQSKLASYQSNRDSYIRELPAINWTTTPAYNIAGGASDPKNFLMYPIQDKYNAALDCAVIYYLTGDTNYAQFASDILHNGIRCTLGVTPSSSTQNGGWIYQADLLYEARVIGNPLPIIYDFMYTYLQSNQVYDVKSGGMVDFSFSDAQSVFRTYYGLVRDHGLIDCNWPALESSCMIHNLLGLDTKSERDAALQVYLTTGGIRQDSLAKDYLSFPEPGSVWPESLIYASDVAKIRAYHMVLIERYDTNRNVFATYPNLPDSLSRIRDLRYPNKQIVRFGDSGGGRFIALPLFEYELVYQHAKERGYTVLASKMGALINAAITDGEYSRTSLRPYSNLTPHNEPLQLLWQMPEVTETAESFVWPRSDRLPHAGLVLQRNFSSSGDPDHGLMFFVGGAAHVHSHASGMNMELYGLGEVLGAKGGSSNYATPLHDNYYRNFASHNTVIVNGASRGQGGWNDHAINTVTTVVMDPEVSQSAVSSNISFSCNAFLDDKGTLAEATQQRSIVLVRSSPTTGFYVDIFRTKSTVTSRTATTLSGTVTNQYHDYIYRNIGTFSGNLETNGAVLALYAQANRFQNDIGDANGQPGWRYFTNTVVSYPHVAQFHARFEATPTAESTKYMDMYMPAVATREVARADSPPISDAPSPYGSVNSPTLAIRQIGDAWDKPFVSVFEPHFGASGGTVTNTTALWISGIVVGVKVESVVNGSNFVHFVISNTNSNEVYTDPSIGLSFTGRLAVVSDFGPANYELYLGSGKSISYRGYSLSVQGGTNSQASMACLPGQAPLITANSAVNTVTASAPIFDEISVTNGTVSFGASGSIGVPLSIWAKTNLTSGSWNFITSSIVTGSSFVVEAGASTNQSMFYRFTSP